MRPLFVIPLLFSVLAIVAGCKNPESVGTPATIEATAQAEAISTRAPALTPFPSATNSPRPTLTPSPTSTPNPSPTPTPTAVPVTISGDPRAASLKAPVPHGNAPCGVADVLDFPLDPPNGAAVARGGRDFGVFRGRYDKYHAGEDWWRVRGGSNFGEPVYSVGHGLVTYAQPEGWGRDKGVVVIRHYFSDESTILSFYGHLDPPSVTLAAGECVVRGEMIGKIGRPSSPPHLHLELRSHLPYQPGTGYWPTDPALAGWEPPSQFISNKRIVASPGVSWTRPPTVNGVEVIGMLQDGTLVAIEKEQLIGLDTTDGSLRWSQPISGTIDAAMADARLQMIYTADQFGTISSYRQADFEEDDNGGTVRTDWSPLWSIDLDLVGFPIMMPLSDGGIIVAARDKMAAISADGRPLWEVEDVGRPFDWARTEDGLVFSTIGDEESLWTADGETDPTRWNGPLTGRFVAEKNRLWLLEANGIYQLDTQSQSAERRLALPPGLLNFSDLAALPNGKLLLVHSDRHDRRLILLDSDNSVRWERSIASISNGKPRLFKVDDQVYLLSENDNGFTRELDLFSVDVESAELTRLFTGSTRTPIPQNTFARPIEDGLILLNIGGGSLAVIDPQLARDLVSLAAVAQ